MPSSLDTITYKVSLPKDADHVLQDIEERMREHQWDRPEQLRVRLAAEEGMMNAIKHAHCLDPKKIALVTVTITDNLIETVITDEGPGFNPGDVPDATLPENLEKEGGRGILLMRALMDTVSFNAAGNSVCLIKKRAGIALPL